MRIIDWSSDVCSSDLTADRSSEKRKGHPSPDAPSRNAETCSLQRLQVHGRGLAALRVALFLELHLLALVQAGEARTLHGGDMDEHVRAAGFRQLGSAWRQEAVCQHG